MCSVRFLRAFLFAALSSAVSAQNPPSVAASPSDPLELATGATLKVASPENRSLVLVKAPTYPPRIRAKGQAQTELFINVEFGGAR